MSMTIAGGCLCGAVRFVATAPPVGTAYCHCRWCRRHTGAPVAAFADFRKADVTFTAGTPAKYASSPGALRGFCAACGSTLTFEGDNTPDLINIHVGALDEPEKFPPAEVASPESRLPWLHVGLGHGPQGPDA